MLRSYLTLTISIITLIVSVVVVVTQLISQLAELQVIKVQTTLMSLPQTLREITTTNGVLMTIWVLVVELITQMLMVDKLGKEQHQLMAHTLTVEQLLA